mgnify:FL=1
MDILVTFPDGTTELRAANSPAFFDEGPRAENRWPKVAPNNIVDGEAFPPEWTGLGYLFKSASAEQYAQRLSTFQKLALAKPFTPIVWTERWGWRPCTVETVDEQIARLTRERDAAVAALRKIASHPAKMRWSPDKQTSVDADGEPWLHWAEIARMALEGT